MKTLFATSAILALAAVSVQATTIYQDDFSGADTDPLNGTTPDTTTTSNTWLASTDWLANGTAVTGVNTATNDDNAFLAFTPSAGNIYTLSATMSTPTTPGTWVAIGFTETANLEGSGNAFWQNIATTNSTVPWLLYRNSTNIDTFLGASPSWITEDEGDVAGPVTFSIVLNTEGAAWTAEWFVNGGSVRGPVALSSNPTGINYVGLGRDNGTSATFTDFTLTAAAVPEPTSLALLGLGGLCMLRRRRI